MMIQRLPNESEQSLIWRLGNAKSNGEIDLTWSEVADIINAEFRPDEPYQESAYRKQFQMANLFYETVFAKQIGGDNFVEQLREERQELYKVKTQVRDERNQLNRKLRDAARMENTIDNIQAEIASIGRDRYVPRVAKASQGESDLLCCVSDIHYGIEFDSYTGAYNSDIARQRMGQYASKLFSIGERHEAKNIYVSLLGDLLSGQCHYSIAVENRENLIEQIIGVSEMIADFVYTLSGHFDHVYLNSVGGNHSRVQPKDMAVKDERLDNLVVWHLQSKFSHMKDSVTIVPVKDNIDSTVAEFMIRGKSYVSVHGDYDPFTDAGLSKLIMWLGYKPYAIVSGHMHTPWFKEVSSVACVMSGSMSGSGDDYTVERRLRGDPSQMVSVVDEHGIDAVYPVKFR